jgi:hypothetical protein
MKRYVLGEFSQPALLVEATRRLRQAGVTGLDAYSPYPLHDIDQALGLKRSPVPIVALVGGLSGACGGYFLQYWMNAVDWPINVANRPPHSFWQNIPITFESGILLAVLSIFLGSVGYFFSLPQPYHGVFESEQFRTASLDAFWIGIETEGDTQALEEKLRGVGAARVHTVTEAQ